MIPEAAKSDEIRYIYHITKQIPNQTIKYEAAVRMISKY